MAKSKAGKTRRKQNGPTPSDIVYRGPVRTANASNPNDTINATMSFVGSAVGGSTGMLYSYNTTNMLSCPDWSSFAATYSEFRVLGFELQYLPHYPAGNASVTQGAGFGISLHSSEYITPSTDITQFIQHSNWRPFYTGVEYKMQWKMSSVEEAVFESTASLPTVPKGTLSILAPTASSTGPYGYVVVTYLMQFRDRK